MSNLLYIAIAIVAVLGVVAIVIKKGKLPDVRVQHGLDKETAQLAEKGIGMVGQASERGFDTASHVADKAAEIVENAVAPLSSGIGDVLHAVADRIKGRQAELNKFRSQAIALAQEVERLKGRQIDVTGMNAQLKLGLLEISQQRTSFRQQNIELISQSAFVQESNTEYLGLHRVDYRIQIGLDIERLKFQLTSDGRVLVDGLRNIEIIGLKNIECHELLNEVRRFVKEGTVRSASAEILLDDKRCTPCAAEHRKSLLQEIQSSQSLDHLVDTNAEFALAFLRACLSAGGIRVEEAREPLVESLRFSELCQALNRLVAQQIDRLTSRQIEIDDKSRVVEGEILTLALEHGKEKLALA